MGCYEGCTDVGCGGEKPQEADGQERGSEEGHQEHRRILTTVGTYPYMCPGC